MLDMTSPREVNDPTLTGTFAKGGNSDEKFLNPPIYANNTEKSILESLSKITGFA